MPMTDLPGIGARMRMLGAMSASARSSVRLVMRLILTPAAGSSSYMVMTGPGRTSTTRSTPKSASFFQNARVGDQMVAFDAGVCGGSLSSENGGS